MDEFLFKQGNFAYSRRQGGVRLTEAVTGHGLHLGQFARDLSARDGPDDHQVTYQGLLQEIAIAADDIWCGSSVRNQTWSTLIGLKQRKHDSNKGLRGDF
ncbi:hypothetical protein ASD12_26065 [Mesorhizobium sp. Root102]|uniref:hypothetical protein n=1 Tax=Mesorhizobium sp. Root102 TaxID=1736422 RepID=UPI0006F7CB7D|nr:hypothetical protein [Mesorhizobium sp. Root102]KQU92805.1 hypothetical protein ASD12_26065 [Mesorhizobium sp. Root102]